MERQKALAVTEAVLFAVGESVTLDKLADILEVEKKEMREIIAQLKEKYEDEERGILLIELENSVQLVTKDIAYEYLVKIAKTPPKQTLTDTVLETLSIIAYKQPVTRGEIEKIRGVSCDHAINKLLEYDFIEEVEERELYLLQNPPQAKKKGKSGKADKKAAKNKSVAKSTSKKSSLTASSFTGSSRVS